ncbi:HupE/UreJ family protein [Parasphingorhabdus sp.]|uniref:HupE/UreJ family protein n=1 Tax=Parasphingorhabdus sp. TaxID=2709688 RepID=UPI0032631DD8
MNRWLAVLFVCLGLTIWPTGVRADELRPAYIEMTEQSPGQWSLLWKASENSRLGRNGRIILPQNCQTNGARTREFVGSNILTRLSLQCEGSIQGQAIGLEGLELSSTDALARIAPIDSAMETVRLTPDQHIATLEKPSVISNVAATYTIIGFEHIILGFDHLFFVLALVLLLKGGWLIAKTVTAFTIAHSLTLVGTTLGLLSLPSQPVEAVIALSIIFLAVEVVKSKPGDLRLSERFPWIVAFLFGLLHGFGFAGALAEIGLPEGDVPLALLTFNLGVEIGQLAVVALALAVLHGLRKFQHSWLQPTKTATAYAIGIIATYWFIERMVA